MIMDPIKIRLYAKERDIKKIDFGSAENYRNDASNASTSNRFYESSGLKHLIRSVLNMLDKNIYPLEAIFIENSTITTATTEGHLSAFTAFWHEFNDHVLAQEVFLSQYNVIDYLQKEMMNMFWHQDFFIAPSESYAYFSRSSNKDILSSENNDTFSKYKIWLTERNSLKALSKLKIPRVGGKEQNVFVYNNRIEMEYSDVINEKSVHVSSNVFSLSELHSANHNLYHRLFFPNLEDSQETVFLSIPLLCPYASGIASIDKLGDPVIGKFAGLGAIFILMLFKKGVHMTNPDLTETVLPKLVSDIFNQSKDFASFYSFSAAYLKTVELRKQAHELNREATKAAIAQVMSRNLSHNIGSHVLPEYRTYFKKFFVDFLTPDASNQAVKRKSSELSEHEAETRRDNLNHFFNYTQSRMELTADISIPQDKRISFNYSMEEIKEEFKKYENNLLPGLFDSLNKEDAKKISIKFRNEKGKNIFIPGGQLGKSALYLIIENILRNYYKHSNREVEKKYEFTLSINEPDEKSGLRNNYWCVDFYDCHEKENKSKRSANTADGKNAILTTIQGHIDAPVLDPSDKILRKGGWGFIEMKAACAFLLNYSIPDLDSEPNSNFPIAEFPPILLEAGYYHLDNKRPRWTHGPLHPEDLNLGFRFYLKKAKVLLIDDELLEGLNNESKKLLSEWESVGIEHKPIVPLRDFERTEHELLLTNKDVKKNTNQRVVNFRPLEIKNEKELLQNAWTAYIHQEIEKRPPQFLLNNKAEREEGKFPIMIDDHGTYFRFNGEKPTFKDLKGLNPEHSYFLQSTPVPSFPQEIFNVNGEGKDKILDPLRIIETAKIRISVFDERIQKDTRHKTTDLPELTLRDLHELGGVFIPCINSEENLDSSISSIDLDAISDQNVLAFWEMVEKRLGERKGAGDDYVIVHYTLFEKACPAGQTLKEFFGRFSDDWKNRLLFCSGRGRPSNLVPKCMYLNLSTLQDVLVTKPSKFVLVNILKSL